MITTRTIACFALLVACSSRTIAESADVDGGLDVIADRAIDVSEEGMGGQSAAGGNGGGAGASGGQGGGPVGGTGGSGATNAGGNGGVGATGGAGGAAGKGGTAGGAATGGTAGTGDTGGSAGTGASAGAAGRGGIGGAGGTGATAGSSGAGGLSGGSSGSGGISGAGGSSGTGGLGGASGSGGTLDAGWDAADGVNGPPFPPWPQTTCPSGGTSPLLGTWVGYVENHKFTSGSDALRLTVQSADANTLCGTLVYGESTPLPPPQVDIGYPPGANWDQGVQALLPLERFAHTLFSGLVSGKRVRFHTLGQEPWKGWCGMQTSYAIDPFLGVYLCIPGRGDRASNPDGGPDVCWWEDSKNQTQPLDCDKWVICRLTEVCICNSSGCGTDILYPIDFDAQFDTGEAHGSIVLDAGNGPQVFNVYLSKTD